MVQVPAGYLRDLTRQSYQKPEEQLFTMRKHAHRFAPVPLPRRIPTPADPDPGCKPLLRRLSSQRLFRRLDELADSCLLACPCQLLRNPATIDRQGMPGDK